MTDIRNGDIHYRVQRAQAVVNTKFTSDDFLLAPTFGQSGWTRHQDSSVL